MPLDGRVPVILCGVASTAVFAVVWVFFVYRNDPYVDAPGAPQAALRLARKPRLVTRVTLGGSRARARCVLLVVLELARARVDPRARRATRSGGPATGSTCTPTARVLPSQEALVRFEVNSEGERGDEPPADSRATYRILVAGGSAAECYFLDQPSTWPEVLKRELSTARGPRARSAPPTSTSARSAARS